MKKIISVVGARPNFMKVAPLFRAFQQYRDIQHLICHTGQHYDDRMSRIFFEELELPRPDFYLGVGSGTHAEQLAGIMLGFEKILQSERPDLVIVVGDVNSTVACSLIASRFLIPIAHVEAGLRSFDRTMPEEINRLLTDALADYLFVSEPSGIRNLQKEGIPQEKIFFVGNVMIDSLLYYLPKIAQSEILQTLHCQPGEYILVTLHRPSNVDHREELKELIGLLREIASLKKIIFPVHPRTRNKIHEFSLEDMLPANVIITEPLGYLDFMQLVQHAALVITDSGGIQEETTFLQIPCITVRNNTERPVTVEIGTNRLAGTDPAQIKQMVFETLSNLSAGRQEGQPIRQESVKTPGSKDSRIPELWDGHAAERIAKIIYEKL
ncbi:UDP-N-acetylglucosamine 2-epimerase (non-hydrolysing) [Thermoflavifilum aggregans]|uniref:UDP-N-acetylglucosamine 2-epimerase (Non-hydrolysing) n=1 Tax=Thermoflavifilum aggregans TaxID=454188 RepID=A0A2M9CUZ8_9BACT|nr:UDP-N-acetylglucosamine 2-epimerase (non-hydrolyzing) [Thermoflavifilum aggregans]PJJ75618.1 UDP-N-acetylglucosamine 2-epimerase (non-hydrolysing) [Thermoflavifilum aggregans]